MIRPYFIYLMHQESVRAVYHHVCCTKTKGCNAARMLSYFGIGVEPVSWSSDEEFLYRWREIELCKKTRIRTGKNIMCKTCVDGTSASRYIMGSTDPSPFNYYNDHYRCTYYYTTEQIRKIKGFYENLPGIEKFPEIHRCVQVRGDNKAGRCEKHYCHECFEEPDRFRESFYCFLMCSRRIGFTGKKAIPKDVRKMIHNMSKPFVDEIHTFYFPKKAQWYMYHHRSCPTYSKAKICRQRTKECSVYTPRYNFKTWLTKTPHCFSYIPEGIESVEEFAELSVDDVIKMGAPDVAHAETILYRAKKYGICERCQKYELECQIQEENKQIERFIEENLPRVSGEVDENDDTYTEFVLKNLFKNPSIITKKELDKRCKREFDLGTHLYFLCQVKLPHKLIGEDLLPLFYDPNLSGIVKLCIQRPHFYIVLKRELTKRLPVFANVKN